MTQNKKTTKKSENEPLFIGVPDPVNLRKGLLETSKVHLTILKKIEEIKLIRSQKDEAMNAVNLLLKEIKTLMIKLKKSLPSSNVLKSAVIKKNSPAKETAETAKEVKIKIEARSELEQLESEIAQIESKLSSM